MALCRVILLFGIIFSLLADVSFSALNVTLPIVDLGYELHQAIFNARIRTIQYYNFSNIRYGPPLVGNLRFTAPTGPTGRVFNDGSHAVICVQVLPAWTAISDAWLMNGTAAFNISAGYQPPNLTTLPPVDYQTSEDCLFLDLMAPKAIFDTAGYGPGAPVMVWIHGGGYTLGSKTLYSPSAAGLIKASHTHGKGGVIWIAMNYRLGIFVGINFHSVDTFAGFLSGPTFQANGTANAGLHHQRFALEWVQQNTHKFGGDPNRVTVVGESAGGGSTLHQITAYGGLKGKVPFQQAIVQSPGFQMMPSCTGQEAVFQSFLSRVGVESLQGARVLSTEFLQLVNYQIIGESAPYGTFTFNPAVDGKFVPALPGKLLFQGGFDESLNIMAGHNINEGIEFMDAFTQTEARIEADFRIYFPTITDATIQYITQTLYPQVLDGSFGYTTGTERGALWVTEAFFTCSTNYLARAYGEKTHNYIFSVPPSLHEDDIWYTYYDGPSPLVLNDTLAEIMQDYFTNFAITGNPNGPGLPNFPTYGSESTVQSLGLATIGPIQDNVANQRCLWWQKGLFA